MSAILHKYTLRNNVLFYRCKPLLSSYSSKFITHRNWVNGIYNKRRIHKSRGSQIDDLQITQNSLCFFCEKNFYAYNRTKDGTVNGIKIIKKCEEEFTSLACCNDVFISGHMYVFINQLFLYFCLFIFDKVENF